MYEVDHGTEPKNVADGTDSTTPVIICMEGKTVAGMGLKLQASEVVRLLL